MIEVLRARVYNAQMVVASTDEPTTSAYMEKRIAEMALDIATGYGPQALRRLREDRLLNARRIAYLEGKLIQAEVNGLLVLAATLESQLIKSLQFQRIIQATLHSEAVVAYLAKEATNG